DQLRGRGFSDEQIAHLTPQEAQEILNRPAEERYGEAPTPLSPVPTSATPHPSFPLSKFVGGARGGCRRSRRTPAPKCPHPRPARFPRDIRHAHTGGRR